MQRTKQEFLDHANSEAEINTDYEVIRNYSIFPFIDKDTKEPSRSAALIFTMSHMTKPEKRHTVIVAYKKDGYYIWCGDSFISGFKEMTKSQAIKVVAKVAKTKGEESVMMGLYKSTVDSGCRFSKDGECSHVDTAFAHIARDPSLIDKLEEMYVGKAVAMKNRTPIQMLEKLHYVKHVMLQGDKGSGKTTLALIHAKESGADSFFMGGNSKTEATDFIGEYIPMSVEVKTKGQNSLFDGNSVSQVSMVWKDGKLAQAFRNAAAGKKSIFVLDEVLRIPQEELSPLISALSPTPDGKLQLGTRRAIDVVDGLAQEEILECSVENLWVIMTTNMGADYAVSVMDEAFADRVRLILMNSEENLMKKVLTSETLKNKYPKSTVDYLMSFFKLYERRRVEGAFSKICNLRHLVEAINHSINKNDIKESLWETRLAWVSNNIDGQPRPDQLKELTKILDKVYAA